MYVNMLCDITVVYDFANAHQFKILWIVRPQQLHAIVRIITCMPQQRDMKGCDVHCVFAHFRTTAI